jgi:hypothetical protein
MSIPTSVSSAHRRLPLSVALATAFGVVVSSVPAVRAESPIWAPDFRPVQDRLGSDRPFHLRSASSPASPKSNPHHPSASHIVKNCLDDGGPDTLRSQILAAGPGETVDLSTLACSKITLTQHHALEIHGDVTLKGPATGAASLTISAGMQSSVIYHGGGGTLSIVDLTISDGLYHGSLAPRGGCVYSNSNVYLSRSVVSHCSLESEGNKDALGGAVYTRGDLSLKSSTITQSSVVDVGSGVKGRGGGAYVGGNFSSLISTISDNFSFYQGGGVFVLGDVLMGYSAISGNRAGTFVGALEIFNPGHTAVIYNSTISDNHAMSSVGSQYGGIWSKSPLTITSSTVAFNSSRSFSASNGEGIFLFGAMGSIKSSIVAGNFNDSGPADLGGKNGASLTQDSAFDLITSSTLSIPFDTIKDCPKLDALADTGNLGVKTHGLLATSPAIDQGNSGLGADERGKQRHVGAGDDIGAFERQPTDIADRIHISGFDGICDR